MKKEVIIPRIKKSKMLEVMLNEMQSILENQNSSALSQLWSELFGLDREIYRMYGDDPLTAKITDLNNCVKDMDRDDIDDLICQMSWEVIKDVEKCIKGSSGTLIIINDNEGE